ncbi:MAG: hypothetical protein JNJ57_17445 [Saprospiraceae bacterium]|nr:hypothetical protein [Saprospiraceae bacterium]
MKKNVRFFAQLMLFLTIGTSSVSCFLNEPDDERCGNYNGEALYKEESGDCYYLDDDCNKVYVPKSNCNC